MNSNRVQCRWHMLLCENPYYRTTQDFPGMRVQNQNLGRCPDRSKIPLGGPREERGKNNRTPPPGTKAAAILGNVHIQHESLTEFNAASICCFMKVHATGQSKISRKCGYGIKILVHDVRSEVKFFLEAQGSALGLLEDLTPM